MAGQEKDYRYLIVGGGMTADAAVRGIRSLDTEGSIGLIGVDPEAPYNRPPLTKGLWKGNPVDKIWRGTAKRSVDLHLGRMAVSLDPDAHTVTDDQGRTYGYDKLLLATGGFPRRLPFDSGRAPDESGIIYYRTFQDYQRLRALANQAFDGSSPAFVVIGGGFIGSEITAALAMNGQRVTMVFPGEFIAQRMFPHDLAAYVTDYFRGKGVAIASNASVVDVARSGNGFRVTIRDEHTSQEQVLFGQAVVAGIGILPAVELAEAAGLKVDAGIVVDEGLRTSHADVYAAGDVARFYNPALSKWMRVEHEDNANTMGTTAGKAMAGARVVYHHLPFFYSDLFDLGYEAVGELDSRLQTVEDWHERFKKGVVYYLSEGRVRGVLLWNVWGKTEAARELIARPGTFSSTDLAGCISFD